MVTGTKKHLEELDQELESWTLSRFITKKEMRGVYRFTKYLVNLGDANGWTYDGHSYREGTPMGLMTVRGTVDGTPMISFVSGRGLLECMGIFGDLAELDALQWRPDQYRTV